MKYMRCISSLQMNDQIMVVYTWEKKSNKTRYSDDIYLFFASYYGNKFWSLLGRKWSSGAVAFAV